MIVRHNLIQLIHFLFGLVLVSSTSLSWAQSSLPVYQSSATNTGFAADATVNAPVGVAVSDLLVVGLMYEKGSSEVIVPPLGWTLVKRTNNGTNAGLVTYYKVAQSNEPVSYTFRLTQGSKWAIGISRISNVNTSNPINTSNDLTGMGFTVTAPSLTTTGNNQLILCFYSNRSATTFNPSLATVERYDQPNITSGLPSNMMASFEQATAGVTGNKNALALQLENWVSQQIAISPAPAAKIFYNKSGTDLTQLGNWGTDLSGTGVAPVNFTDSNQEFRLYNYSSGSEINLQRDLVVPGSLSKVVVGNGSSPVTLKLSSGRSIVDGLVEVADNATLFINTVIFPKLGQLAPNSTVVLEMNVPETMPEGVSFGKLVFKTGKKNRLTRNVAIKGSLELVNGKLELGNYDLELDYNASLTGSANNYVVVNGQGRLRKAIKAGSGETVLPIGNGTYNPLKINLAAGSTDDIFSVSVMDQVYDTYNTNDVPDVTTPILKDAVNKTWLVSEDVKGGSNITLTLTWTQADVLPGFDPAACHIKHFENGSWDEASSGAASTSTLANPDGTSTTYYTISRPGITSFSPMTVGDETPLPVELIHFTAQPTNQAVVLDWATASEQNNSYFAVERSINAKNFTEIGRVMGVGTSSIRQDYKFTDDNPLAGTIYYRLRQVDYEGAIEYSPMRAITWKGSPNLVLNVYPNPSQGNAVHVQVQGLALGEEANLEIMDMTGRRVLHQPLQGATITLTTKDLKLTTKDLKAGTYLVQITGRAGNLTKRLVIK